MQTAIFVAILFFCLTGAQSCGVTTHNEICHRALQHLKLSTSPVDQKYASIVERHQDAFQMGGAFPDAFFALQPEHDIGEFDHWKEFQVGVAKYIHNRSVPNHPWDTESEKLIAFILGVTCHSVADIGWHAMGKTCENGFISQVWTHDWDSSPIPERPCCYCYSHDAHTQSDTGGDIAISYEYGVPWMATTWYYPVDMLMALYPEWEKKYPSAFENETVSKTSIIEACTAMYAETASMKDLSAAGRLLFNKFETPFVVDRLQDYYGYGLEAAAVWVVWTWPTLIRWIEQGVNATMDRPAIISDEHKAAYRRIARVKRERLRKLLSAQDHNERSHVTVSSKREDGGLIITDKHANLYGKTQQVEEAQAVTLMEGSPYSFFGSSIVQGDFNNDGIIDLAIGAPGLDLHDNPNGGAVFLRYGPLPSEQESKFDAKLVGSAVYGQFGQSLAVIDWNGDGLDDLAVGAPSTGSQGERRGVDYVPAHGQGWSQTFNTYPGQFRGTVHIFLQRGAGGFDPVSNIQLNGTVDHGLFGYVLSAADVNADGRLDLLVGSPMMPTSDAGAGWQAGTLDAYLVTGEPNPPTAAAWTLNGVDGGGWFGHSIAYDRASRTLVVGAPYTPGSYPNGTNARSAGAVWGFSTASPGAPVHKFTIRGGSTWEQAGYTVGLGRLNAAGLAVVIASPTWTAARNSAVLQAGRVQVFLVANLSGTNTTTDTTAPLASLEGSDHRSRIGYKIVVTDIDRDGTDDLILSEPWQNNGLMDVTEETGAVYAWKGGPTFPQGVVPEAGAQADWGIHASTSQGRLGTNLLVSRSTNGTRWRVLAMSQLRDLTHRMAGQVEVLEGTFETCPKCACTSPTIWPVSGCNVKCGAKCADQGCCYV